MRVRKLSIPTLRTDDEQLLFLPIGQLILECPSRDGCHDRARRMQHVERHTSVFSRAGPTAISISINCPDKAPLGAERVTLPTAGPNLDEVT